MADIFELIEQSQKGDKNAKAILVKENAGLVWNVVRRFMGRGYEAEDLFQIGMIGLIHAIDKFDQEYQVRFSTYAVPLITGEIRRFLRDDGMIKISRNLKENRWKIKAAREKLGQKLGRDPAVNELAEELHLSCEDIIMATEAAYDVESIDQTTTREDGKEISLLEKIPNKENESERILNHLIVEEIMGKLDENERRLIHMRYFENMTQLQVAKLMNISQVQVSRLEKKILRYMKEQLK